MLDLNDACANVVRINVYTTNLDVFLREGLDTVFGYFGETWPAATLVGVTRLANPRAMVEIEVVAVPF